VFKERAPPVTTMMKIAPDSCDARNLVSDERLARWTLWVDKAVIRDPPAIARVLAH